MPNKISVEQIKKLREKTAAGIMECRKALEDANGNIEKAEELLLERGIAKAEKKADRIACDGVIASYIHAGGKVGVLVEVNCETDFVARTDTFQNLVKEIGMQIAAMNPKDNKDLLSQVYIRDSSLTVEKLIKQAIGKLGENIVIKRFTRYELGR